MLEKLDLDEKSSAAEEEEEIPDSDSVPQLEIEKAFQQKFYVQCEEAVSLQKNYVLHLDKSGNSLVVGLSNSQIQVFDLTSNSLSKIHVHDFKSDDGICGVRFLHKDPQIFVTGQTSGSIAIHDRREGKVIASLEDITSGSRKPFTAFDVNANDRVICAGTEQILHDVFLLFFDVRQRKLLGGYWESHEDDITSIDFHPRDPNILATGSTDGLINVFDIAKPTEEDAMDYSLNTEKTVQKINWHSQEKGGDLLTCIMDSHDFHIYETKESTLVNDFSREKITERIFRTSPEHCSTIGCHSDSSGGIFLMAGIDFHPRDPNILATGSTDGLINVFDIAKPTEEDAMDYSLNTEKTVQKINWHSQEKGGDLLTCIMDSHDFHIYETKESTLVNDFSREKITERIFRTSPEHCSTIGCHSDSSGGIFLMAGSNFQNGKCLRMLQYRDQDLHPYADFLENDQIIRSYVYDQAEDFFITGGENGIISLWGHQETKAEEKSHGVKRRKIHQTVKPY
uniref:WD repeat-containing protein 89 n=1 Tax=Lutzomyia longipalpis TaxID=7200 RepID=A0A1B0EZ63_LUTLO